MYTYIVNKVDNHFAFSEMRKKDAFNIRLMRAYADIEYSASSDISLVPWLVYEYTYIYVVNTTNLYIDK